MKKRILALLLVAAMTFSVLAACGSKDKTETPDTTPDTTPSAPVENEDPAFGADLFDFYCQIMDAAEEGPFMMDIAAEAEMLEMTYPGLAAIETKQLVAFTPAMSAVAIEFAFVEVANAADVDAVKAIFQTRIDNQVAGGAWYPETIEGWENNSEIVVIDNYVCLFVCEEKDGMIEALRNGTEVPVWAKMQTEGDMGIGDMEEMFPVEDETPAYDPEAESSSAPETEPAPAGSIDLAAFYNDLHAALYPLDAEGFSTGPFVDDIAVMPEMLEMYYPGMTALTLNQVHVYLPMMSAVAYEVALVEVADAADVEAVKAILQTRIDTQVDGGAWYPETIEGWENNSRIITNGNFVMMVVATDFDAYIEAFNAQF